MGLADTVEKSWLGWLTGRMDFWSSAGQPLAPMSRCSKIRTWKVFWYNSWRTHCQNNEVAKKMLTCNFVWLLVGTCGRFWQKYVLIILGQAANGRICINHRFMRDFLTWRYLTPTIYIMDNIVMMTKLGTSMARSVGKFFLHQKQRGRVDEGGSSITGKRRSCRVSTTRHDPW